MLDRLDRFVERFAVGLLSSEQHLHLWEYVAGLYLHVKRKITEAIAYLYDQDR
ncbi:MAG: hypothetical protein ACC645_26255 [Pirellulales bacterium]